MQPTIFIQVLVLSVWNTCHAWRTFKIIVEDSSIELDERYINVSIGISSDYKNESLINMYVTVLEDMDHLMAHLSVTAKTSNGEEMNLLNVKGNFCRFLIGRKDGNIRLFFENIQKFGKIFLECPVTKGSYYLRDLKIDPDLVPDYLPEATFVAMANVFLNDTMGLQKSIVKINLIGKFDKSQGLDNFKVFSMG